MGAVNLRDLEGAGPAGREVWGSHPSSPAPWAMLAAQAGTRSCPQEGMWKAETIPAIWGVLLGWSRLGWSRREQSCALLLPSTERSSGRHKKVLSYSDLPRRKQDWQRCLRSQPSCSWNIISANALIITTPENKPRFISLACLNTANFLRVGNPLLFFPFPLLYTQYYSEASQIPSNYVS